MPKLIVMPLAVALAAAAFAQEKAISEPRPEQPPPAEVQSVSPGKGAAHRTLTTTGKVTNVDRDNRVITLQTPKGDELTMKVGPSVKRLDMASPGDTVTVKYEQGLMMEYRPEGAAPAEQSSVTSSSTKRHEAVPSATTTEEVWSTVKVAKVDPKSRVVSLQDEKGKTFQLKAGPNIDLGKIKAGQTFAAHYTETVAVSLTKAGGAKAAKPTGTQ